MRDVLEQLDGEGMSFADVLPMLSFFQTRSVKQTTTFRGPIEIGDTIKINVYGYVKVGLLLFSNLPLIKSGRYIGIERTRQLGFIFI